MTSIDPDLAATIDAVFAAHRADSASESNSGVTDLDRALWRRLDGLGLVRLTGAEAVGGSGASWWEAAALVGAAARHAVRLPFGEHDLLACALLDDVGLPSDDGLIRTLAVADSTGQARGVPWAPSVDRVVVLRPDGTVVDAEPSAVLGDRRTNLIGEPRASIHLSDAPPAGGAVAEAALVDRYRAKAALLRAVQVCAALDRAVELAVSHTSVRTQFGRPLARQQAVQALVAAAAAEAALARTATDSALAEAVRTGWSGTRVPFLVAVARSCAGHAASVVVRNTHQVHGAIGTTREYPLHEFTRAALAWRGEFGSVAQWDRRVHEAALAAGPDGLWELMVAGPSTRE